MFYYDSTILLLIPALLLSFYAQSKVMKTYGKYLRYENSKNLTGMEVARRILDSNNLYNVEIIETPGELSDHYDPRTKKVNLSPAVYRGNSISSMSIAAHEVGHAIQDSVGYYPLKFRSALAPVASLSSHVVWILIMLGFMLQIMSLLNIGIILFSIVVLFQIITLPVEFNASKRALDNLKTGFVSEYEISGSREVLKAAALTYVAAALTGIMQLLRFILLSKRNRD